MDLELDRETMALHRNLSINLLFVCTRSWSGRRWPYLEIYQSTSSLYGLGAGLGDEGPTQKSINQPPLLYGLGAG
jgi:hypothetical protein